jgi:hypothetical protein
MRLNETDPFYVFGVLKPCQVWKNQGLGSAKPCGADNQENKSTRIIPTNSPEEMRVG